MFNSDGAPAAFCGDSVSRPRGKIAPAIDTTQSIIPFGMEAGFARKMIS